MGCNLSTEGFGKTQSCQPADVATISSAQGGHGKGIKLGTVGSKNLICVQMWLFLIFQIGRAQVGPAPSEALQLSCWFKLISHETHFQILKLAPTSLAPSCLLYGHFLLPFILQFPFQKHSHVHKKPSSRFFCDSSYCPIFFHFFYPCISLILIFSPLHSPASTQHHLSPWKPLWNDSYLTKWPNLALFLSLIMTFPFEFLLSLDFHGLVALSSLWIFPEYFSLCSHPLLPANSPYILESPGVLYPSKAGWKLSCSSVACGDLPSALQSISPHLHLPSPSRGLNLHILSSGEHKLGDINLLCLTSFHIRDLVYPIIHFHLPLICSCLQLHLNFHWGTPGAAEFSSSFPKESLPSKLPLLPLLTKHT